MNVLLNPLYQKTDKCIIYPLYQKTDECIIESPVSEK